MDTLSGEATPTNYINLPPETESTLKGKNLLPGGAKTHFQKGFSVQENKQEVTKLISLAKIMKSLPHVPSLLKQCKLNGSTANPD